MADPDGCPLRALGFPLASAALAAIDFRRGTLDEEAAFGRAMGERVRRGGAAGAELVAWCRALLARNAPHCFVAGPSASIADVVVLERLLEEGCFRAAYSGAVRGWEGHALRRWVDLLMHCQLLSKPAGAQRYTCRIPSTAAAARASVFEAACAASPDGMSWESLWGVRDWVPVGPQAPPPPRPLRVLSYNTLSSDILKRKCVDYGWIHAGAPCRGFHAARARSLKVEVRRYAADLMCLTEVEGVEWRKTLPAKCDTCSEGRCVAVAAVPSQHSELASDAPHEAAWAEFLTSQGYEAVYRSRPSPMGKADGTIVAYRKGRIEGVDVGRLYKLDAYLPLMRLFVGREGIPSTRHGPGTNNIAVISVLRDCSTGLKFTFAAVHLYWNPEYEPYKQLQATLVHGLVHRAGYPAIVAGDFNAIAGSESYDNLRRPAVKEWGMPALLGRGGADAVRLGVPEGADLKKLCQMLDECGLLWVGVRVTWAAVPVAAASISAMSPRGGEDVVFASADTDSAVTTSYCLAQPRAAAADLARDLRPAEVVFRLEGTEALGAADGSAMTGVEYVFRSASDAEFHSAYGSYRVHVSDQLPEPLVLRRHSNFQNKTNETTHEPMFTTYTPKTPAPDGTPAGQPGFIGTLDYIFHTGQLETRRVARLRRYEDVPDGLPTAAADHSDHLPICAELAFRKVS